MTQKLDARQLHSGAFASVGQADQAIRRLHAAGFSHEQLAVVCPPQFQEHFGAEVRQSETPHAGTAQALATGGALGLTLGGLALAATVLTGGVGAAGAAALIGGGAFAGAFSGLIVAKGYEQEADDYFKKAIERGLIVVGVEVPGEDGDRQKEAQRILDESGARAWEFV